MCSDSFSLPVNITMPPSTAVSGHPLPHPATPASVKHVAIAILSTLLSTSDPHSVYSQLQPFLDKPDHFLDPCPSINQALSHLVSVLQGTHDTSSVSHDYDKDDVDHHDNNTSSNTNIINGPIEASNKLSPSSRQIPFVLIAKQVCQWIDNDSQLLQRAATIRDMAERAEGRLELFYVQKMVDETIAQLSDLTNDTNITPATKAATYVQRIADASQQFPYINNYLTLVDQEARIIQQYKPHPKHIVFCGSGPLPFTGLLFAAHTMASHFTFVDYNLDAVIWSRKLIHKWEQHNVIPKGRISVIHHDASLLQFQFQTSPDAASPAVKDHVLFNCDVLFVAALIPNQVKLNMFKAAQHLQQNTPVIVLRTAHGLTARLAYHSDPSQMFKSYLPLAATVVPQTHALSLDQPPHIDNDQRQPVEWFPNEILNTLEIYTWPSNPKSE